MDAANHYNQRFLRKTDHIKGEQYLFHWHIMESCFLYKGNVISLIFQNAMLYKCTLKRTHLRCFKRKKKPVAIMLHLDIPFLIHYFTNVLLLSGFCIYLCEALNFENDNKLLVSSIRISMHH